MKVRELLELVDRLAPFRYAEAWDNVGLQFGHPDSEAEPILIALEATPAVLREARECGARTLLAHHPLLFGPVKCLVETSPQAILCAEVIRAGLNLIAAHTNIDSVAHGTNGELADRLGLRERRFLRPAKESGDPPAGLGLIGELEGEMLLGEFAARCKQAFGVASVGVVGEEHHRVRTVAVCSGAGGEVVRDLDASRASVLVTGELNHHQCGELRDRGVAAVLIGHHASEAIFGARLAALLRERAPGIDVRVSQAEAAPVRRV